MDEIALQLGPTVDELVAIAKAAGEQSASRRTINGWTSEGWVLRPRQKARKWRYPNAALGQVDTIARLRARGVHKDFFRFALFVEVGTGDPAEAQAFALEYLTAWKQAVEEHEARFAGDPSALRDEAATAARKRGKNAPFPHRVRATLDERTTAMLFTIANLFSAPLTPEEEYEGQRQLERLVGLRSGRGGAERDLTDIAPSPKDWPTDPDALIAAVTTASVERLELSRRMVELGVVWFPALRSLFVPILGAAASAAFVDVIEQWERLITPDMYPVLFSIGIKNASERASDVEITEALRVLQPAAFAGVLLGELADAERKVVLRRLRPYERLRVSGQCAGL